MNTLLRTGPNSVRCEAFEVWESGDYEMTYRDSEGREIRVPIEFVLPPFLKTGESVYTRVRMNFLTGWKPPHDKDPFTAGDYRMLKERLTAAFDELMPNKYRFEE